MFHELLALLFFGRDFGHRAHLRTQSFAAHNALDTFYKDLPELVDKLVEVYQGRYGLVDIPFLQPDLNDPLCNVLDPVGSLTLQVRMIEALREQAIGADSTLQNIVDEILALYGSTLYKLRFLK